MSYRFGKQGISIPPEVSVKITGQTITTVGPKGTLVRTLPKEIRIMHYSRRRLDHINIKDINDVKQDHTEPLYNKKDSLSPIGHPWKTKHEFHKNSITSPTKRSDNYDSSEYVTTTLFDIGISYFWPVEWIYDSNPWEIYYNVSAPMASCFIEQYWYQDYIDSRSDLNANNNSQQYKFRNLFGILQTDTNDPALGVKMLYIRKGKPNMISNDHVRVVRTSSDHDEAICLEYSSLTPYPETNLQGARYVKSALWRYRLTPQATVIRTKEVSQFSYLYRDKASRKDKTLCSIYGLELGHLNNMVKGVSIGFKKILIITGVGYRAQLENNILILNLGFSHSIKMNVPNEISVVLEGPTRLIISGIQKEFVGEFAAKIRAACPPEPYKGKGISYETEIIRRKVGKTGK